MVAKINSSGGGGASASGYTLTCLGEGKAFGTAAFDAAKTEEDVRAMFTLAAAGGRQCDTVSE